MIRPEIVEDIEWMLDQGEHPANIVRRVGASSARALVRWLQHRGRADLARALGSEDRRERRERRERGRGAS